MNLLILSSGTRNKIVEYFKRELAGSGNVICADASEYAPTLYIADGHYVVPKIDDPNYLDIILSICKKENIKGVLSLIDPELTLLSKHKKDFENIGVIPFVSDHDKVELCFDKYKFYLFCVKHGFPTVKSFRNLEDFQSSFFEKKITFPVFVKPRKGSCSVDIQKVENFEDLKNIYFKHSDVLIQEFMDGKEYGADVYVDLHSREITSIFIKEKLLMRAGETDKATSVKDTALFELIKKFVEVAGFIGQIDLDIFKVDNKYYFSEVNPRFGGGYPHAYECGCNFPKFMIENILGNCNGPEIGKYEENVVMMKYLDLVIKKDE